MKTSIIKKLAKRIEADNEAFAKLSKAEKRVAIAEDCIERIKAKQFYVRKGSLVKFDFSTYDWGLEKHIDFSPMGVPKSNSDLKPLINSCEVGGSCQVCAKGALFMSFVGRVNNFLAGEVTNYNDEDDAEHKKLQQLFSLEQLSLIETAFEGRTYLFGIGKFDYKSNQFDRAKIWAGKFQESDERLIKICENIIQNKGTFIP